MLHGPYDAPLCGLTSNPVRRRDGRRGAGARVVHVASCAAGRLPSNTPARSGGDARRRTISSLVFDPASLGPRPNCVSELPCKKYRNQRETLPKLLPPQAGRICGVGRRCRKRGVFADPLGASTGSRLLSEWRPHPGLARPSLEDGFSYGRAGGRRRHRRRGGRSRGSAALARDVVVSGMVEQLVERVGGKVLSADGTGNGDGHRRPSEYRSFTMSRSRRAAVKVSRIARPVSFRLARSALKLSSTVLI